MAEHNCNSQGSKIPTNNASDDKDRSSSPGENLRREPGRFNLLAESEFSSKSFTDGYADEESISETVVRVQNFECGDVPKNLEVKIKNSKTNLET